MANKKAEIIGLKTLVVANKHVPPGKKVKVDAAEAEHLVNLGHARWPMSETVSEATEPASPDRGPVKPKDPSKVQEAIREILPNLNTEEDFTAKGDPNVAAIEKRLGYDITMAERDDAWAGPKAAGAQGSLGT